MQGRRSGAAAKAAMGQFSLASQRQRKDNARLSVLLSQSTGCVGGPMAHAHALFQLGIDLDDNPSASKTAEQDTTALVGAEERTDFFIERNGERFAGTHLIVDLWGAERNDALASSEDKLRECGEAAKATLLHTTWPPLTPNPA